MPKIQIPDQIRELGLYVLTPWRTRESHKRFELPRENLRCYLGGSTALRLALGLSLDGADIDLYFQGDNENVRALDWLRKPIGQHIQRDILMMHSELIKQTTKAFVDPNEAHNSFYMWTLCGNDYNIGSVKLYSNFQILIDIESGEIQYDSRIPEHEAKFNRFLNEDLIITENMAELVREGHSRTGLRVLSYVLKSYLKPLNYGPQGKHFDLDTASAIVSLMYDVSLVRDIKQRFEQFYMINPVFLDRVFYIAERSMLKHQTGVIAGLQQELSEAQVQLQLKDEQLLQKDKTVQQLQQDLKEKTKEKEKAAQKHQEALNAKDKEKEKEKEKAVQKLQEEMKAKDEAAKLAQAKIEALEKQLKQAQQDLNKEKSMHGQAKHELRNVKATLDEEKQNNKKALADHTKMLTGITKETAQSMARVEQLEAQIDAMRPIIAKTQESQVSATFASMSAYYLRLAAENNQVPKEMSFDGLDKQVNAFEEQAKGLLLAQYKASCASLIHITTETAVAQFMAYISAIIEYRFDETPEDEIPGRLLYRIIFKIEHMNERLKVTGWTIRDLMEFIQHSGFSVSAMYKIGFLGKNVDFVKIVNQVLKMLSQQPLMDEKLRTYLSLAEFKPVLKKLFKMDLFQMSKHNNLRGFIRDPKSDIAQVLAAYADAKKKYTTVPANELDTFIDAYLGSNHFGKIHDLHAIVAVQNTLAQESVTASLQLLGLQEPISSATSSASSSASTSKPLRPTIPTDGVAASSAEEAEDCFISVLHAKLEKKPEINQKPRGTLGKHLVGLSLAHIELMAAQIRDNIERNKRSEGLNAYQTAHVLLCVMMSNGPNFDNTFKHWDALFHDKEALKHISMLPSKDVEGMKIKLTVMKNFTQAMVRDRGCVRILLNNVCLGVAKLPSQQKPAFDTVVNNLMLLPEGFPKKIIGDMLSLTLVFTSERFDTSEDVAAMLKLQPILSEAMGKQLRTNNQGMASKK